MTVSSRVVDGVQELDLELDTIEHLFALPVTDYFSEYRNYLSGIDELMNEVKARPLHRPLRVRLHLPAHEVDGGTEARLRGALERYCRNRVRYNHNEIRSMRRDGIGAFGIGLAILGVGLLLSEWLRRSEAAPDWVTVFLSDGLFLVLAWVGMWYPMDVVVFANRPYQRENKALARLVEAELVLVPYGEADDAAGGAAGAASA